MNLNPNLNAASWESELPEEPSAEALELLARYKTNTTRLQDRWDEIAQQHSSGWVAVIDDGTIWADESHTSLIQRLSLAGMLDSAAIAPLRPLRNFIAFT
jgi:hypothetical protein